MESPKSATASLFSTAKIYQGFTLLPFGELVWPSSSSRDSLDRCYFLWCSRDYLSTTAASTAEASSADSYPELRSDRVTALQVTPEFLDGRIFNKRL